MPGRGGRWQSRGAGCGMPGLARGSPREAMRAISRSVRIAEAGECEEGRGWRQGRLDGTGSGCGAGSCAPGPEGPPAR